MRGQHVVLVRRTRSTHRLQFSQTRDAPSERPFCMAGATLKNSFVSRMRPQAIRRPKLAFALSQFPSLFFHPESVRLQSPDSLDVNESRLLFLPIPCQPGMHLLPGPESLDYC